VVITALLISVLAEVVSSVLPMGASSAASTICSCTVTDCEMASTLSVIETFSEPAAATNPAAGAECETGRGRFHGVGSGR